MATLIPTNTGTVTALRRLKNSRSLKAVLMLLLGSFVLLSAGCFHMDPLKKHNLLTTVFDGVPDLPDLDELCQENVEELFNQYYEERITEASMNDWEATKAGKGKSREHASRHRPWAEKNCRGCHNFKAKNKLKRPLNKICFLCHKNFIQGTFVHGPVAVGACTACHNPHSTGNPSLLKRPLKTICFKCHKEKRLAAQMHAKIIANGMYCVDCHDPHSRNVRYFLK